MFDDKTGTDEHSMVACVFHYMKCQRENPEFNELEPHIDVEYNRMIVPSNKREAKCFQLTPECDKCGDRRKCSEVIKAMIEKQNSSSLCEDCKKKYFRPDLIVHKRNSEAGTGNGLVVEFKKCNPEKEKMVYDIAKVRACTCERGRFKYKVGAFVILEKLSAQVCIFSGGQYRGNFSVDKKGRKESSTDCSQVCQEA